MRNNKLAAIYFGGAFSLLLTVVACQVRIPAENTPESTAYGQIDRVKVDDGFPKNPEPWVVISDRANNPVGWDKTGQKSPKDIKFLEPLLVVKHDKQKKLIKVAEYNPDALMKKLPSSSVKTYGWIPEDQLLLWNNAIRNSENGFKLKAALTPNHSEVLKNGDKYIKNDSVIIYSSPDLAKPTDKKLPIGQLVYIYKHAENASRYLIGKSPSLKLDSISNDIYGWVNSNMLAAWGDRTALKVSPQYVYSDSTNLGVNKETLNGSAVQTRFLLSDAVMRKPVENLISVTPSVLENNRNRARFFANAFDHSNNFVYNVLGEPLMYNRYKEITRRNKNLNVVFALDMSRDNLQNTAVAKSVFQNIQVGLSDTPYYKNIKYGVVLYKNNTCGDNVMSFPLTSHYGDITAFIDQNTNQNCTSTGAVPIHEGLDVAGQLFAEVPDETNLLVLVGSTAPEKASYNAIRSLSSGRVRTLFYQTVAGSSNEYNNFVIMAENILTNTAQNIAEINKERVVDQSMVLEKTNYNLIQGEEGVYSLDYPAQSMSQGFVLYPKKGEQNSNSLLAKSFTKLLDQVTYENTQIDSVLISYFRKGGSDKSTLKPDFRSQFGDAPALIPSGTASQLIALDYPVLTNGVYTDEFKENYPAVEKGILLSESEFDALRNLYSEIYNEAQAYSADFSQSRAINNYISVLKQYNPRNIKFKKSDIMKKSMSYSVATSTGFDNSMEEILTKYTLEGWKKSNIVPAATVKNYFNQYKILSSRMLEQKSNPKIQIKQGGETFYWLNSYFMPSLNLTENL